MQLKADGSIKCVYRLWSVIRPSEGWMIPTATCRAGEKPLYLVSAQAGCRCEIWRCRDDVTFSPPYTERAGRRRVLSFKHLHWHLKYLHMKNGAVLPLWKKQSPSNIMFDRWEARRGWTHSLFLLFSTKSHEKQNQQCVSACQCFPALCVALNPKPIHPSWKNGSQLYCCFLNKFAKNFSPWEEEERIEQKNIENRKTSLDMSLNYLYFS